VQYALKAIVGLRHGEVAGLRWRHYDPTLEPLGRLVIATSYDTGRTKTDVTRRVPVHPTLCKILAAWKLSHWERIYGRAPTADDLVVPTRNLTTVDASDAVHAFKADLAALGLRIEAGEHRDRGGHDLRSWFITTCQEHGAHRDLLRVVTHTSKGDVVAATRARSGRRSVPRSASCGCRPSTERSCRLLQSLLQPR
jgi:integrase